MEDIYLKGYIGRREWCSENVSFKSYFEQFSDMLSPTTVKRKSDVEIMQDYIPMSSKLSELQLFNLTEATNPAQLTTLFGTDLNQIKIAEIDKSEGSKKKTVQVYKKQQKHDDQSLVRKNEKRTHDNQSPVNKKKKSREDQTPVGKKKKTHDDQSSLHTNEKTHDNQSEVNKKKENHDDLGLVHTNDESHDNQSPINKNIKKLNNQSPVIKKKKNHDDRSSVLTNQRKHDQEYELFPKTLTKKKKNRLNHEKSLNSRREIVLDAAEKIGQRDVLPKKHYMVSFRVHEPFSHRVGDSSRPGRCSQELAVLGHQSLCALRDKIICVADFQDTMGDVSAQPDYSVAKQSTRDVYFSGMFYFGNTFYIDCRLRENIDYSRPIKVWAKTRGIKLGITKSMENTKIEDLEIRFGYPYVYMHQGNCEHLIVINDARLVGPKDSLCSLDYPLISKVCHHPLVFCQLCARHPARWIVRDCDRLPHDPTFECKSCFKYLHYINGKKIGNFKAYHYWQRGSIL